MVSFKLITVGIADLKIASSPDILRTILGSCVGICLYDPEKYIGGLSHIMLPSTEGKQSRKEKYADSAIPLLLKKMEKMGAIREVLIAKIIGGAKMFELPENSAIGKIGENNVEMVKKILKEVNIEIIAEDVGGENARTIDFYIESGRVKIKTSKKNEKII